MKIDKDFYFFDNFRRYSVQLQAALGQVTGVTAVATKLGELQHARF